MPPPKSMFRIFLEAKVHNIWQKDKSLMLYRQICGINRRLISYLHKKVYTESRQFVKDNDLSIVVISNDELHIYNMRHNCKLYRTLEKMIHT